MSYWHKGKPVDATEGDSRSEPEHISILSNSSGYRGERSIKKSQRLRNSDRCRGRHTWWHVGPIWLVVKFQRPYPHFSGTESLQLKLAACFAMGCI